MEVGDCSITHRSITPVCENRVMLIEAQTMDFGKCSFIPHCVLVSPMGLFYKISLSSLGG
jgi:hypothetical protein